MKTLARNDWSSLKIGDTFRFPTNDELDRDIDFIKDHFRVVELLKDNTIKVEVIKAASTEWCSSAVGSRRYITLKDYYRFVLLVPRFVCTITRVSRRA